jgi:hypothetical protein
MPRVYRKDLMSKSAFSKKYHVTRSKLDALISADYLNTENISGLDFIRVDDPVAIENALDTIGKRGYYPRIHDDKSHLKHLSDWERQFEADYEESMK